MTVAADPPRLEIDASIVLAAIRKLPRAPFRPGGIAPRHIGTPADLALRSGLPRERIFEALKQLARAGRIATEWRRDDATVRPLPAQFIILEG